MDHYFALINPQKCKFIFIWTSLLCQKERKKKRKKALIRFCFEQIIYTKDRDPSAAEGCIAVIDYGKGRK